MKNIFISYTLKGKLTKTILKNIKSKIENQNINCYVDIFDNEYNITNFQEKIYKVIDKSELVIVLYDENYYYSKWALIELDYAMKKNKEIIFYDYYNNTIMEN